MKLDIPKAIFFGHPKFDRKHHILTKAFQKDAPNYR